MTTTTLGPCLSGLHETPWRSATVIVPAVYREWGVILPLRAPDWLVRQAPVYLYQRLDKNQSCFAQNRGYESGIYLRFLLDHLDNLPAHTVFAQADWFSPRKGSPLRQFDFWQLQCLQHQTRHGNSSRRGSGGQSDNTRRSSSLDISPNSSLPRARPGAFATSPMRVSRHFVRPQGPCAWYEDVSGL